MQANPALAKHLESVQHRNAELEASAKRIEAERVKHQKRADAAEDALRVTSAEAGAYRATIREYAKALHRLQRDLHRRPPGEPVAQPMEWIPVPVREKPSGRQPHPEEWRE